MSKAFCLAVAIAILAGNTAAASSGGVFSEVDNDGLLRINADTAGYSFDGWYMNGDFTGTKYDPGNEINPSGDTDLYARWLCDLKWDLNGGIGGSAKNSTFYEDQGTTVTEPVTPPTQTGMEFTGWYKDSGCKDQVTFPYKVTKPTTLYAGWEKSETYTVKYAVCLWGINQDKGEGGNTLGLTFGPATGDKYTNSFKACPGTSAEDPGNCLHWMTWDEIIEKSKSGHAEDFADCLANGCTHSVNINITGALKGENYSGQMDDGDGTGILYNSIASSYRKWNNENVNTGGWPASRMRATLNGKDSQTDTSVAGDDCLDENACLLAMFPEDLQKGIVAKAVKSDTVYNNVLGNNTTTYDKLWLFSGKEVYDSGSNNGAIRSNEGDLYQRSENLGITTSAYSSLKNYNEFGSAYYWWLRSVSRNYSYNVCLVNGIGDLISYDASNAVGGFAPGFCLK